MTPPENNKEKKKFFSGWTDWLYVGLVVSVLWRLWTHWQKKM
jgi:hypothetical protein